MLYLYEGNSLGGSTTDGQDLQVLKSGMLLLEVLDRARALARHFKVDPILPSFTGQINRRPDLVDELYALVFSDEYRRPAPHASIRSKARKSATEVVLKESIGPLTLVQPVQQYDLLGCPVSLGPVQTQITEMKLLRHGYPRARE